MEPKFKWSYFFVICLLALFGALIMQSARYKYSKNYAAIKNEIAKEVKRFPKLKVDDLYKFIHQAAKGSEHAVKDSNAALNWMQKELISMNKEFSNNLLDTLSTAGNLVRVNLRPYIKQGYDTNKLTSAFVQTANKYNGSEKTLKIYWKYLLQMAHDGEINFSIKELENYFKIKKDEGFPAVHHSTIYEELYHPAYRVVSTDYLKYMQESDKK